MNIRIIVIIGIFLVWTISNYIKTWEDKQSTTPPYTENDFIFYPIYAILHFFTSCWFPAIICGIIYLIFC